MKNPFILAFAPLLSSHAIGRNEEFRTNSEMEPGGSVNEVTYPEVVSDWSPVTLTVQPF